MKVQEMYSKLVRLNRNGEIYRNVELKNYNTFRVGGKAKLMVIIKTLEGMIKSLDFLDSHNIDYFVLGNGSNVLVSDKGYDGVIVKFAGDFEQINPISDDTLEVGCATYLSSAYLRARELNLSGLEMSVGIPATCGGAVYMNCSAYDFEMSRLIDYVVAYHNGKITYLTSSECKFGYRDSIFQHDDYIIIRIGMKLEKSSRELIMNNYNCALSSRRNSQPLEYPSAGCVFKRMDGCNVSKMLDDMGAKGMSVGGAIVSNKHANFIINNDNASAQDIYDLINIIKEKFCQVYNINLVTEIKFLGEF